MENEPNGNVFWFFGKEIKESEKKRKKKCINAKFIAIQGILLLKMQNAIKQSLKHQ